MKKLFIPLYVTVAVFAALACSKETVDISSFAGEPLVIEVAPPEFDVNGGDSQTKISFNGSNLKHKFDAGDYFHLYSYTDDGSVLTDWSNFTTDAGGAWARFHGVIPDGYASGTHGDKFRAFYHSGNTENMAWNSSQSRFECKFNIPSQQDGTGLKYCIFANSNEPTFTIEDGKPKLALQFRCYNGLCYLNLVGGDVRTIRVTVHHALKDNFNLVSSGANKDIVLTAVRALSGGGSKTVTISNGGSVLSGDIFFATRQTNGSATNGYAYLVFEFENGSGQVCTKYKVLAEGHNTSTGTATTYKNISQYFTLMNFGTIDLTSATFVDPS
jgi:hypothetical protein